MSDIFKQLKDNKATLIAQKKFELKKCDAVFFADKIETSEANEAVIVKAQANDKELINKDVLSVKLVINTTNLMDSHKDVHFPGIWKKSIKDKKSFYLLKSHKMDFEFIISDSMTATAENIEWRKLGFDYDGKTQALIFSGEIHKDRNEFMFNQYANGYVTNHSVGMMYVSIDLAINSNDKYYRTEKDVWDKYINDIANKEEAEANGYFWAVTEAKIIEGSAVPMGSNHITPVLSIKDIEPSNDTQKEDGGSHESTFDIEEFKQFFTNKLNS